MTKFDSTTLCFLIFLMAMMLVPSAFSQDQTINLWQSIESFIAPFVSIIFLAIFILMLLGVAGVLPKPKTPVKSVTVISLLVLISFAFILPQLVPYPTYVSVPDNFKLKPLPTTVSNFFVGVLGLPEEWMYIPAIIYLFILPFAGIYAVVWSFLSSLSFLFPTHQQTKVIRLLAFIITFLTIPIGWFVKMVWVLFSFMGAWSVALFVVTFVVGSFFRGAGVVQRELQEFKKYTLSIKKIYDEVTGQLKEAKNLPLQELQRRVNSILDLYSAQLPTAATEILRQISTAPNINAAKGIIDEAIDVLKKQLE